MKKLGLFYFEWLSREEVEQVFSDFNFNLCNYKYNKEYVGNGKFNLKIFGEIPAGYEDITCNEFFEEEIKCYWEKIYKETFEDLETHKNRADLIRTFGENGIYLCNGL